MTLHWLSKIYAFHPGDEPGTPLPVEVLDLPQPRDDFSEQSGEMDSVMTSSSTEDGGQTEVNVSFDSSASGEAMNLPQTIRTEKSTTSVGSELQKFLMRPVDIYTYTWNLGGTTEVFLDPWYLFFSHTSISKKIDNYYLLKCNLRLKIVVNASPFYYGAMLVSYKPLTAFSNPTISSSGDPLIPRSQLPRVYVYPSVSQGGTMLLPYVYYKEWMDVTSLSEVSNMGRLTLSIMDALRTASTSTSPITVKVYAWAEDVQLSAPTVKFSLQSGKYDEYGKGIVSKPASAIARAAGRLTNIPVIGPYATATQIAGGAVASIASLFGYTNVPVIDDVHSVRTHPLPAMAATDIGTSVSKLALDSKNELTIDSSVCGLNLGDELDITNFVTRESYLTKFAWSTTNDVDGRLFNIGISPMLSLHTPGTGQTIINHTPMALMQYFFDYWRGDIEVRFKIICSQYHRGRLRISWDPIGDIANNADSTTEVYTKIIDITDTTDFTIRVPYMSATAYLTTSRESVTRFGPSALNKMSYENGVLTVRVLTELSSPVTTADVSVLVFVKGSDNLEFACPREQSLANTLSPFTVQSGELSYDDSSDDVSSIALKPSTAPPELNLIYHGETVKSLRTLLRRAQYLRTQLISNGVNVSFNILARETQFSRYPMSPGFDPLGINTANRVLAAGTAPYNWVQYTPISLLGSCFLGTRGSIIWYVEAMRGDPNTEIRIGRPGNTLVLTAASYTTPFNLGAIPGSANGVPRTDAISGSSTMGGQDVTKLDRLPAISMCAPYYSLYKFRNSSHNDAVLGSTVDFTTADKLTLRERTMPRVNIAQNAEWANSTQYAYYCSAGPDFSFIFFLCVPTLYLYNSVPTAP